jgi:hypothetical protein
VGTYGFTPYTLAGIVLAEGHGSALLVWTTLSTANRLRCPFPLESPLEITNSVRFLMTTVRAMSRRENSRIAAALGACYVCTQLEG